MDDDYDREFDAAIAAESRRRRNIIGAIQIGIGGLTIIGGVAVWLFLSDVDLGDGREREARYILLILGVALVAAGIRSIFKEETEAADLEHLP